MRFRTVVYFPFKRLDRIDLRWPFGQPVRNPLRLGGRRVVAELQKQGAF
jgi:hypothetical protein